MEAERKQRRTETFALWALLLVAVPICRWQCLSLRFHVSGGDIWSESASALGGFMHRVWKSEWWYKYCPTTTLTSAAVRSFMHHSGRFVISNALSVSWGQLVWQPLRSVQSTDLWWDAHTIILNTSRLRVCVSQPPREAAGLGFIACYWPWFRLCKGINKWINWGS